MAAEKPASEEVQAHTDEQMLELIRETVEQLEELGGRLEEYAQEQVTAQHERELGEPDAGATS